MKYLCYSLREVAGAVRKPNASQRGINKKAAKQRLGFVMVGDQILAERRKKSYKKKGGLRNINQTLHLVGSHMAEQHAYRTNLLISSNRVQLIPLAASSADYQLRAPGVWRRRKKVLHLFFCPKSRGFKHWVMNEEEVGALSTLHRRKRPRADGEISRGGDTRGKRYRSEKLHCCTETAVVETCMWVSGPRTGNKVVMSGTTNKSWYVTN